MGVYSYSFHVVHAYAGIHPQSLFMAILKDYTRLIKKWVAPKHAHSDVPLSIAKSLQETNTAVDSGAVTSDK